MFNKKSKTTFNFGGKNISISRNVEKRTNENIKLSPEDSDWAKGVMEKMMSNDFFNNVNQNFNNQSGGQQQTSNVAYEFYDVCQNCGAPNSAMQQSCEYCGATLIKKYTQSNTQYFGQNSNFRF